MEEEKNQNCKNEIWHILITYDLKHRMNQVLSSKLSKIVKLSKMIKIDQNCQTLSYCQKLSKLSKIVKTVKSCIVNIVKNSE